MLVLKVENVVKIYKQRGSYSTKALNGINFEIKKGEFVGIMGPSGSGKTTLLNILSGIDRATSGKIEISGKQISQMSNNELALFRRQHLGFVFQEFNLLDSLSIKENVLLPMILDKKESSEMETKVHEVMSLFDISNIMNEYPYEISGGQQQRSAVSRAIINDPDIMFADEPTGNLDSKSSNTVMECFEKLNKKKCTILIVTHDPFAASFCKRVLFIKDGLVDKEIFRDSPRKDFFNKILEYLTVIGRVKDAI